MSSEAAALTVRLRAAGCVFAEDEAALLIEAAGTPTDPVELDRLVAARVAGVPLEVLVGWAEFCGLRIAIDPGVFVPRRRSELIVQTGLDGLSVGAVVVDLGCGSGALAAAVLAARPDVDVHAVDLDPTAVACARRNLPPGRVHEGDLYDALPESLLGRVTLVVANAPYVPTDAIALMPPEARDHEHRIALDGGPDGLDVQRRVTADVSRWLACGGRLIIETGQHQAPITAALMADAGLTTMTVTDDEGGTVVVGR